MSPTCVWFDKVAHYLSLAIQSPVTLKELFLQGKKIMVTQEELSVEIEAFKTETVEKLGSLAGNISNLDSVLDQVLVRIEALIAGGSTDLTPLRDQLAAARASVSESVTAITDHSAAVLSEAQSLAAAE